MGKTIQRKLDNGLTVLLKEVHSAPVISFWMAYRIGSRNEPTGKTGISHWVEHMLFKGTDEFPAGTLDKEIDRAGGQWNAMTSTDYTMYYETLPADRIDIALRAEADRMRNAKFAPEETESERTVIISERQGSENYPVFWLREEVHATAFRVHGYHHEIIGDMADLQTIKRNDLYDHYKKHYVPGNATTVAVGDFNTEEMFAQIQRYFADIPAAELPELFVRPEPPQPGERRVKVERPGETAFLEVAYRAPQATQEDWFKLEVLDSVLTGPGGGVDNKTSRLYQALVKSELAVSVSGGLRASIDPYLYSIMIVLRDGVPIEKAEAILLEQIDLIAKNGITQEELAKARKQARASFAYESESVMNQAYYLAQSAILEDYQWFDTFLDRLQAVTLEDVHEAAQKYLTERNRIVGYLIPTGLES